MDKIKEVVRKVINEAGPSKSFNKLASLFQKEALKHQSLVDAQKKLANAFVKETDPKKKEKLRPELIAHHKKVKAQEEIKNRAEAEMMLALDREPLDDVDENSSFKKKDNLKKVLKKYGYGHNPLEDGKIKESFDTKKWKRFYDMAKDKSGKTFKQFEKEFGDVLDRPHIADAIKNASDYFDFLKRIKRFEESVTEASFPKRSFTDFVKNATAEDKNQFKRFTKYMNDFYGKKGVYPDKKGRDLSHTDVMSAVDYLIKKGHKWGGGDSLDREVARDYLIDKNKLEPTYNEGINEVKIKPTKTISKEKWKKTHKDYKSIIDGVKYVLMMTDQGTSLVPVTVESVNEVMGYKLNARDKQIIDEFVMKDFDAAMKLYKNGAYYVEKVSSGWALKGSMSGTLAAWIGDTLYYGQAYGNVTQTVINYVKKTAKYYKIQPQYKELQKI